MTVLVFDSGAGGAHVAQVLAAAGIPTKLETFSQFFPFGDKSERQLLELFKDYRAKTGQTTIFCACNTMSLVLKAHGYDFRANNVIPTFPQMDEGSAVCFGTHNTIHFATLMSEHFNGVAVAGLVKCAEDLYQDRITLEQAQAKWDYYLAKYDKVQLGSTHLSYLAHRLGVADKHVEPDYLCLYLNHIKAVA